MKAFISPNGVKKFSFGKVLPTETILESDYTLDESLFYGDVIKSQDKTQITLELREEDIVYGLGQNVRGINKRGHIYEAFCSDDPNHTPDKKSLYGAHNFLIIYGEKNLGIYIDFPGKITYDVGFTDSNLLDIVVEGSNLDIYQFEGSLKEIVNKFRRMIGPSYVPPKWAFGYQQCRWSYEDQSKVKEIASGFEKYDIPVDAIYLDIDYMEDYKDFTVSKERFPDFEALISELKEKDIKLIPIIDAGVKIEDGYAVYEEGVAQNYFLNDKQGNPFVAAVWPGKVHFPDVLNKEARKWFGDQYHAFLKMGIEGFWNDMNEPAIFYSENGLKEAIDFVKNQEGKNLDVTTFFALKDSILNISNAVKDYKSMYHRMTVDDGEVLVNHYDVHNLYGYNITRAADEGFKRYDNNKRFFLLTRASHIGMAKHSGIWTGDNHSWWEHIKLNIQMMPSLGMAGFLYAGADTGGFGFNASAELVVRWLEFSMFTPLLRNHSAMGTRVQEPWQFNEDTTKNLRNLIRMRYALVPYLYSEFMKANKDANLLYAPLSFVYEDEQSKRVEDQLLLGDEIMIAPVYEQNAKGRYVYLPEDMVMYKITSYEDLEKQPFELIKAGHHYIPLETHETVIFIRKNRLLVLTKPQNRVKDLSNNELVVIGYVEDSATYQCYNDDGTSFNYRDGKYTETNFKVNNKGSHFEVSVDTNDYSIGAITFYLIDSLGNCKVMKQGLTQDQPRLV
ncbi:TIM-barrel domain-containing protein [Fusibacter bizertensis]